MTWSGAEAGNEWRISRELVFGYGGAGFIGSHIVDGFSARARVRVVDN
jgi:hypothetical protein